MTLNNNFNKTWKNSFFTFVQVTTQKNNMSATKSIIKTIDTYKNLIIAIVQ